jgi:DNA-binding NarL/FixJ family response regulator
MSRPPLRILLADDHDAVRRGLRSLLEPRWEIAAEVRDGRAAVAQAQMVHPDVVLLDLHMPGLNGLDAARQIRTALRTARILLLTTQPSEELTLAASHIGIDAVVVKSDAERLFAMLVQIERETVHLAGGIVGEARHIAAFFTSEAERYRVLAPFVAEGLANGEKAIHIVDAKDHVRHVDQIAATSGDFAPERARQLWELTSWEEMYLCDGGFDQEAMLKRVESVLTAASASGFPLTRVVAHMEWAVEPHHGVTDLAAYESRLNHVLPSYPDVVVCAYDVTRFRGDVILDVLRAHPAIIVGGALTENPLYVPPAELLRELDSR